MLNCIILKIRSGLHLFSLCLMFLRMPRLKYHKTKSFVLHIFKKGLNLAQFGSVWILLEMLKCALGCQGYNIIDLKLKTL
jgi:hypothetical protein